jgi:hypothetical protein
VNRIRTLLTVVMLGLLIGGGLAAPGGAVAATTFTYVKVADTETPIPGGSGAFFTLGQPGLANGVAYLRGDGAGGQSGIYSRVIDGASPLVVRYDTNTPIPDGGTAHFTHFGTVFPSPGGVAFYGEGSGGQRGIYSDAGGTLHVVADSNTPIPGGTGSFLAFSDPWLWSGVVVFRALGSSGQDGIYAYGNDALRRVADRTTPIPGGTTFTSFGATISPLLSGIPATHDGTIVFRGRGGPGEPSGVYKEVDGVIHVVADTSMQVPGRAETFQTFEYSVLAGSIQDGAIVFVGQGFPGNGPGIYLHDGTGLSKVVDTRTFVPGTSKDITSLAAQGWASTTVTCRSSGPPRRSPS